MSDGTGLVFSRRASVLVEESRRNRGVGKRHWRGYLSRSGRDGGGRKRDVVLSGALTASQIQVD